LVLGDGAHDQPAARQMAMKSAAFNDAPPIRPPSMSGFGEQLRRVVGLDAAAVEDAERPLAAPATASVLRRKAWHRLRLAGDAVLPVPIAQTGS
jgi:hypothetical protein